MRSDPELALLAACAVWPAAARDPTIARRLDAPIDAPRFLALIDRHRVAGHVDAALPALRAAIPGDLADAIAARARRNAREELRRLVEAGRLRDRLAAADVPALFLKGATLAMLAYGQPGIRHCRDTDILVAPDRIAAAEAVLAAAGYTRTIPPASITTEQLGTWRRTQKDATFVSVERRLEVELHWRPFVNPRLVPDLLAERSVVVAMGTVALPTLAPDALFVYLCVHGAYHGWFRLKWLADVAALLAARPAADYRHLVDEGAARGVRAAVAQALVLAHRVFGTPVPDDLVATLRREPRVRLLVAAALRALTDDAAWLVRDTSRSVVVGMSRVLLGDGIDYAMGELWLGLTNPHDLLLAGVPDWLASLYPATRIPLVVARRVSETRVARRLRRSAAPPA